MFRKYDIVYADLTPKKGHVQSGTRPCIVVSNNVFNMHSNTIILIPLTSNLKEPFPSEFIIESSEANGLKGHSRFLGSQIITIDKDYVIEKVGELEEFYHVQLRDSLKIVLDFDDDF